MCVLLSRRGSYVWALGVPCLLGISRVGWGVRLRLVVLFVCVTLSRLGLNFWAVPAGSLGAVYLVLSQIPHFLFVLSFDLKGHH